MHTNIQDKCRWRSDARRWFGYVLGFLLFTFGCTPSTPEPDKLGLLKTDISNNLLLFSNPEQDRRIGKAFTLYNDGRIPIRLTSMHLQGENSSIFRILPQPSFPLELKPGKEHALSFKVHFLPTSKGIYRGSLSFESPNVENVDESGFFHVHLYSKVTQEPNQLLYFDCGKVLDLGKHPRDEVSDRSCTLKNNSSSMITIRNVSFIRERGGSLAFRWLKPELPFHLEAKSSTTVTIRFTAGGSEINEGTFQLQTDGASAALKVRGISTGT